MRVTDGVEVPEGDVGGVISAETRAAHTYAMGAGFAPREIEHIVHNHIFISNRACRMRSAGWNSFVVKLSRSIESGQ